jgi:ABC-type methionine transport system permease subunit
MRTLLFVTVALLVGLALGLGLGIKIGVAKSHQLQEATRG